MLTTKFWHAGEGVPKQDHVACTTPHQWRCRESHVVRKNSLPDEGGLRSNRRSDHAGKNQTGTPPRMRVTSGRKRQSSGRPSGAL